MTLENPISSLLYDGMRRVYSNLSELGAPNGNPVP